MPVKYIDVTPISELFAPAVRAFGDIAVVGRGEFGSAASPPKPFTSPGAAVTALKGGGTTTLAAAATSGASVVVVPVNVQPNTKVRIGTDPGSEVHTVTGVQSTAGPPATFSLTLDKPLKAGFAGGTAVTQDNDSDLLRAIRTAFGQSPPPTKVWGVQVDYAATAAQWETALGEVDKLDVQIVLLAGVPLNSGNAATLGQLASHVSDPGLGDGKERIGVAMLDPTLAVADAVKLNAAPVKNERMVLVAHKSDDDVAAAMAGVIAGYRPHISLLLKPINIRMTELFSDPDIDVLDAGLVNWITSPVLLPGQALYLGEGYTSDSSHDKKYIDIVRTIDDVNFRIKAALIEAIGNLRISRVGLRSIVTIVQSVLSPLVSQGVIEGFNVVIPLLVLLDRDPASLSPAETQEIATARADRTVDMTIEVVYAGAIHRLTINLDFTG
ncbi:hypothetical protein ACPC54_39820 [Kitasatospora sp. NPDC094028]